MSTRDLPGGKKWRAHMVDNLAAICELIVWKMWEPQSLTTLRASTACTGITLPGTTLLFYLPHESLQRIIGYVSFRCEETVGYSMIN
jgi:hypothetical protein